MEPKEVQGVQGMDCSLPSAYVMGPQAMQEMFEFHEGRVMALTTFGGLFKKMGVKPGEEWKILGAACKSSVEELLAEMDEVGVERVVLLAMKIWSQRDHQLMTKGNIEPVAEAVKAANGRIIGGAGYNPFRIEESLAEIETAVKEFGFKYVWFHPISFGMRPDDRRCYPLYAKCNELGIPVGMQTGHSAEPLTSEPGHPMCADNVAIEFPNLKIILTHTGWPWIDEWCSMIWKHPNVYGMLNAYFPSAYERATVKFMNSSRGRSKILSGSHGFGLPRWKTEFMDLPVSDDTKMRVLRQNPIKVFDLK